jgi:hypothetical protein
MLSAVRIFMQRSGLISMHIPLLLRKLPSENAVVVVTPIASSSIFPPSRASGWSRSNTTAGGVTISQAEKSPERTLGR